MAETVARSGFDLARLWAEAPAFLTHGAGCSCAGHVAMHLDPRAVEADVLDYLAERYKASRQSELAGFVADRNAARGVTFASWLIGIDSAALTVSARTRLLADLGATISSLANSGGGGHS